MMGMDNGIFYEENEDGGRALPKRGEDGGFHVEGRLEVGTAKQAKGLLRNCMPIVERYAGNKKVFLSPTVRFYRRRCCDKQEHCTNMDTAGYRRGMLVDLAVVRDAMTEVCREEGVQLYRVLGTCELLGLKAAMEEDEVERLLGSHPVHMTEDGYVVLAEQLIKTVTSPSQLFVGEKREREEYGGSADIGGWRRKTHDCSSMRCPARVPRGTTGSASPGRRPAAAAPWGRWAAMWTTGNSSKNKVGKGKKNGASSCLIACHNNGGKYLSKRLCSYLSLVNK